MANILSSSAPTLHPPLAGRHLGTALTLAAWLILVLALGANGAYVTPPGTPPLPILFGVLTPLALYFAGYRWSEGFRAYLLAADPVLLTGLHAWRFAGYGFLALYAHRVLPGIFAWPAGLGDILIGLTAPWFALTIAQQPGKITCNRFRIWHLLGILDLVIAVSIGALSSTLGLGDAVTARPMAEMPLVLIPGFFVPLFVMLHVTSLLQARHRRRTEPKA